MSASAGKVMPRPMGEYNGATEYKILDIVTYNDRPYMAKQTTTGNTPIEHPTAQNPDSYWMLLLDFPTEVDNVPTEDSNNLVKSGGVYSAVSDKMDSDASNSRGIVIYGFSGDPASLNLSVDAITKDAGASQSLVLTKTVSNGMLQNVFRRFEALVGCNKLSYLDNGNRVYFRIGTVNYNDTTITATGSLVEDDTAAISLTSKDLYISDGNFVRMGKSDYLAAGSQLAINGDTSMLVGEKNAVTGDCSGVVGQENVAAGACSFAEGKNTTAKGNYSHAAGENTVATQSDQFVVGRNNNPKSQTLFEVGGGGTSSARINSFEVYPAGYVSFDDGETKYKFAKYNGKLGYYDIDGYFHRLFEPVYLTQSVTLSTSGDATMTFTNAAILSTSLVDVYTPEYSIVPKNVVVASGGGSCTVTFGKVSSAQTISVRLEVKNP